MLDEGHKIRNPTPTSPCAKQLQTVHRLIMTGAPIQNRLSELWSSFDFCFPGKLGTLPVFQAQFAVPIQLGGYSNASQQQVVTAYRCATMLKDLISPYLLRRMKADVNINLPKKTEQVLFCPMTGEQREAYRSYIHSRDVEEILEGRREALGGSTSCGRLSITPTFSSAPPRLTRRSTGRLSEAGSSSSRRRSWGCGASRGTGACCSARRSRCWTSSRRRSRGPGTRTGEWTGRPR